MLFNAKFTSAFPSEKSCWQIIMCFWKAIIFWRFREGLSHQETNFLSMLISCITSASSHSMHMRSSLLCRSVAESDRLSHLVQVAGCKSKSPSSLRGHSSIPTTSSTITKDLHHIEHSQLNYNMMNVSAILLRLYVLYGVRSKLCMKKCLVAEPAQWNMALSIRRTNQAHQRAPSLGHPQ